MATVLLATCVNQPQHDNMDDRLDAARALLGVSPSSVAENDGSLSLLAFGGRSMNKADDASVTMHSKEPIIVRRPRSNSAGLDALAFLAEKEHASMEVQQEMSRDMTPGNFPTSNFCSLSSDEDSEAMPPPPPRIGRRRSVSNPEGMEKWAPRQSRLRFVLPASILEEELAEANAAMQAREERALPFEARSGYVEEERDVDEVEESLREKDEADMDQDELLRRARSRLLEDLSEGSLNGEKGVLTLPHALAKYKAVSRLVVL
jgi:hypothetical protein